MSFLILPLIRVFTLNYENTEMHIHLTKAMTEKNALAWKNIFFVRPDERAEKDSLQE